MSVIETYGSFSFPRYVAHSQFCIRQALFDSIFTKTPPPTFHCNLDTLQVLYSLQPTIGDLICNHLTIDEIYLLFLSNVANAPEEDLLAILLRHTNQEHRSTLMELLLARVHPQIALDLIDQFHWDQHHYLSFIGRMMSEPCFQRYKPSDFRFIIATMSPNKNKFEQLRCFFTVLPVPQAILFFDMFEWEQHQIKAFIDLMTCTPKMAQGHRVAYFAPVILRILCPFEKRRAIEKISNYVELGKGGLIETLQLFNRFEWSQNDVYNFIHFLSTVSRNHPSFTIEELHRFMQYIPCSEMRLELILSLANKPHYKNTLKLSLLAFLKSSSDWTEEQRVQLFQRYARIPELKEEELIKDLPLFNIQSRAGKRQIAMTAAAHNPQATLAAFDAFYLDEEAERAEVVTILASRMPGEVATDFETFNIHQDSHKADVLSILFLGPFPVYSIEQLRFSTRNAQTLAIRRAVRNKPLAAQEILRCMDNLPVLQMAVLVLAESYQFDAAAIQKKCFTTLSCIRTHRDQVRAIKWLGEMLIAIRKNGTSEPKILLHSQMPKILASLMTVRSPQLRNYLTEDYIELISDTDDWDCYVRYVESLQKKWFQSKLYQPIKTLLKEAIGSTSAKENLLKALQQGGIQLTTPPDLSSFSGIQQDQILCVFQNYRAYRELLSPEKFESQLLQPILNLLGSINLSPTIKHELTRKVKNNLCRFLETPSHFYELLSHFDLPNNVLQKISNLFLCYQDSPPKFDFQFVLLHSALLQSQPFAGRCLTTQLLNNFTRAVFPLFDLNYHLLLETLHQLNFSDLIAIQKALVVERLCSLFSNARRQTQSTNRVSSELSSLLALLLFIGEQDLENGEKEALVSEKSFLQPAARIAASILSLEGGVEKGAQFLDRFMGGRLGALFPPYIAKLNALNDPSVMFGLRKMVTSVLDNTYELDRYAEGNSPQLEAVGLIDPEAPLHWKTIRHRSHFTLDDTLSFDPVHWLLSLKQQDLSQLPALEAILKSTDPLPQESALSLTPSFEDQLIRLVLAETAEAQLYHLTHLKEHYLDSRFAKEVDGAIALVQEQLANAYTLETSTGHVDISLLGTEIYGSCQHLGGTAQNTKCLIGSFDGKFLPLAIKRKGQFVSRALLILTPTEEADGSASLALFLELYYTNNFEPRFIEKIETLAIQIAKEWKNKKYPVIKTADVALPEGFHNPPGMPKYSPGTPYLGKIRSYQNGWSPFEFSDALAIQQGVADSGITNGEFVLSGNLEYLWNPSDPT